MAVSDFRMKKFRTFLKFLDVNKDGFLTADDYESSAAKLASLSNANEEQASEMLAVTMKWWAVVSAGKDRKIPISEALKSLSSYFALTEPKQLQQECNITYEHTFDLIDTNHDGEISREELKIYYQSHGVLDDEFVQLVFDRIDTDKNGFISRDELIRAQMAFWLSDDPTNSFKFLYDPSKIKRSKSLPRRIWKILRPKRQ